ncbi:hypothetical protein L0U85_07955 [Glycomyces sp. L485]|uniref:hypothetical protein n=1 Tax=Glycomyces sp. L485 TaxID=2909235 RepID=UPI001F4B6F47|nr:hypothetical protein [Glycomyces sp. L485]MCH7230783.1 hypothetical protein [Glycomyces sp. L485]
MREAETAAGSKFYEISGLPDLESTNDEDLPQLYRETVAAGWVEADGSWLLKKFRDEYHGSKSHFTDRTGYEAAVNGRSIPVAGFPPPDENAQRLATRGLTFARRALETLPREAPPVTAYISVSRAVYDDSVMEGNVTFCADHENEPPYTTDLDSFQAGVAAIRSAPRAIGPDGGPTA